MSSNPLSLESTEAARSFYYKAANYAVFVVPACIAGNIPISGMAATVPSPVLKLVISSIPALLMLSAIPAGIVALCGIPKFGKKKLLWKGLVGILVPLLLIGLAIPTVLKIKELDRDRARQMQQGQ